MLEKIIPQIQYHRKDGKISEGISNLIFKKCLTSAFEHFNLVWEKLMDSNFAHFFWRLDEILLHLSDDTKISKVFEETNINMKIGVEGEKNNEIGDIRFIWSKRFSKGISG